MADRLGTCPTKNGERPGNHQVTKGTNGNGRVAGGKLLPNRTATGGVRCGRRRRAVRMGSAGWDGTGRRPFGALRVHLLRTDKKNGWAASPRSFASLRMTMEGARRVWGSLWGGGPGGRGEHGAGGTLLPYGERRRPTGWLWQPFAEAQDKLATEGTKRDPSVAALPRDDKWGEDGIRERRRSLGNGSLRFGRDDRMGSG